MPSPTGLCTREQTRLDIICGRPARPKSGCLAETGCGACGVSLGQPEAWSSAEEPLEGGPAGQVFEQWSVRQLASAT